MKNPFGEGPQTGPKMHPNLMALVAIEIFADLDKIILSGYPYKRFHPRKYNMLKKKYL